MQARRFDAVVVGGGAAGLFCAIEAGKRGRRVAVLERSGQLGRKILISGGGRCNFTNLDVGSENFISQNPHFAKSALARFTPADFISLVKRHRIPFVEKKHGQLFCRESSRAIVEMLAAEAKAAKVEVFANSRIGSVEQHDGHFVLSTDGVAFETENLVIASGGLSFPKVGATGFGYDVARQFGHAIVTTRPSLVALRLKGKAFPELAGVSVDAEVRCGGRSFRENILFTHRGLSGPAILQISNYWSPEKPVSIDLMPDVDLCALFEQNSESPRQAASLLSEHVSKRVIDAFPGARTAKKRVAELDAQARLAVDAKLKHWNALFDATEGWDRAEVTLGGVSTDELDSRTMQSKLVSGLYFIGEVVDVTGWLGGYNFQWAWASGAAAGRAI
ncbi:MAG: oxidoreductase, FAD-dependent [Acidobacteria bacterium OLB17]|nr:MAG: oxidoreductase, FAD-dependent [Acidobacteria bacterium OLB17]MCZ2390411.1 NAD(P)/FAD-dependent oxidoreductase [Acidobacteriota bacterium]